jgi:hypothetical protein
LVGCAACQAETYRRDGLGLVVKSDRLGLSFDLARIYFPGMSDAAHALTQQFLAWVAEAPRSYAEADAWRRSCPHLSIWEDAISDGLVQFENGSSMKETRIVLTTRGRKHLGGS